MCNDFLKINMHEEKNQFCCLSFSMEKLQHQLCVKELFKRQYKQNIQTADSVSHLEANVCPQPSIKSRLRKSPAQILCSSVLSQVLYSVLCWNKANNRAELGQGNPEPRHRLFSGQQQMIISRMMLCPKCPWGQDTLLPPSYTPVPCSPFPWGKRNWNIGAEQRTFSIIHLYRHSGIFLSFVFLKSNHHTETTLTTNLKL